MNRAQPVSPDARVMDFKPAPPGLPALAETDVHVWRASVDLPCTHAARFTRSLSPDERERGYRLHFAKDRHRFFVVRGLLRHVLGGYLGLDPGRVRFSYGPYGKPALVGAAGCNGLCFNLSHSHGLALIAVARHRELGIDVERVRPDQVDDEVARREFCGQELATLQRLSPAARCETFHVLWTRREAVLKAYGGGFATTTDEINSDDAASRWTVTDLTPGPGFAAALAVEGRGWRLKCWQWTGS